MTTSAERMSNFKSVFAHFVGYNTAGKAHTITSLSLITGIPKPTIQSHLDVKGSHPTWPMMLLYMKVLDSAFTDAILSPAGLSVARAEEHESPSSNQLQTELARTLLKLAQALEDGNIDKYEKMKLSPIFRATGQELISKSNEFDDYLKGLI